jgi:hypothetical protein
MECPQLSATSNRCNKSSYAINSVAGQVLQQCFCQFCHAVGCEFESHCPLHSPNLWYYQGLCLFTDEGIRLKCAVRPPNRSPETLLQRTTDSAAALPIDAEYTPRKSPFADFDFELGFSMNRRFNSISATPKYSLVNQNLSSDHS